jgi:hypothetical protein
MISCLYYSRDYVYRHVKTMNKHMDWSQLEEAVRKVSSMPEIVSLDPQLVKHFKRRLWSSIRHEFEHISSCHCLVDRL